MRREGEGRFSGEVIGVEAVEKLGVEMVRVGGGGREEDLVQEEEEEEEEAEEEEGVAGGGR